jgi:ABC-2 type transport system ATP-binding protein
MLPATPGTPRPPESGPALKVVEVAKTFAAGGRQAEALRGVSFQAAPGGITGLIGPDGAGKTTLMRLAAGLLVPDSGHVEVLGLDATAQSLAVQAAIGYMPQRFGLYEDLTVHENLELYADLQGVPREARPERYRVLTQMTGLAPFDNRLAGRLSGGMKQKLGLACTLVRSPRLLLLDEPTVGVDPVSRRELWAIVTRLVEEEGMAVLLSTAYLDEAERCHRVVMLHEGTVLGEGSPTDFRARMEGRTFVARASGLGSRALQEKLTGRPGVVDAVVQADGVRVVLQGTSASSAGALLSGLPGTTLAAVPPRFEDSFVATLRSMGGATHGAGSPGSETSPAGPAAGGEGVPVIEVRDVQRRFGDFYAVKGVSFEVSRGEIFGLLGANGAGKSTTFRMLCGLLPASAGTLRVAGVDLRRASAAARARIGYMSQKFSLYGNLSVAQNLAFFSSAYGLRGPRSKSRMDWALEQFSLAELADAVSGDLPLGYKQRLAMACALMHEPEILFLDEPTSGVDPLARREFWGRISSLAEAGVTILVTTHFMEEAEYCDRLAIMAAGKILAVGTPGSIRDLAQTRDRPHPSMEDAFIHLIEPRAQQQLGGGS